MNVNKIMVALVVAFAVVGSASASSAYISSYTDIYATHFTNEASLSVSNYPVTQEYESSYVAELIYPTYPPLDLSWTGSKLSGDTFSHKNSVRSYPAGGETTSAVSNADEISGSVSFWNCALWGEGKPQQVIELPTPMQDISIGWYSRHPAGSAYPTEFHERNSIHWP